MTFLNDTVIRIMLLLPNQHQLWFLRFVKYCEKGGEGDGEEALKGRENSNWKPYKLDKQINI